MAARFGQPVRYPSHCDALETELQKTAANGGRRLSPSTLRRFFGLVKSKGGYHLHTLDTLARYASHADFAAFGQAVAGLAATPATAGPADIPELLGMERLSYSERLTLGYFLGRITRPAVPGQPAAPLALRLAAHPAGQEFFVESFVDLAHLNGGYGEVLTEYLRHKTTAEAQLFGHCALFLGAFLAEDEVAWRPRLRHLLTLPVPAGTHAFPQGRRAFAENVAACHDAPNGQVPAALLRRLRHTAAAVPRTTAPMPSLPAFYNHFPAGYHFQVAEALFLTAQFAALCEWVHFTQATFPELALMEHNLYNELLRGFLAVAKHRGSGPGCMTPAARLVFPTETHSWLLDYYQAHIGLINLYLGLGDAEAQRDEIQRFAEAHRMPFFERAARQALARR